MADTYAIFSSANSEMRCHVFSDVQNAITLAAYDIKLTPNNFKKKQTVSPSSKSEFLKLFHNFWFYE